MGLAIGTPFFKIRIFGTLVREFFIWYLASGFWVARVVRLKAIVKVRLKAKHLFV
jgi:hypothetical protein